ncbi:rhythmically expressed gene 2 protein [Sitophilus oryzae]|uniref:Rhythmically expressed gene 2 protein n=1 Tax=Sitophilus oryzae TaxID=7048 RepID=A0A6J2YRW5_SITOR|nr:rhythmically expressed gene 2 protein [Sitophilus oryzae]
MNLSKLKLVTFDVTGTLLRLRTVPGQQYGEIGAMYGVVADNNALNKSFKEQFIRMSNEHPNFGLATGLGWENWWTTVAKETFKSSKLPFDDDKLDKVASHLLEMYKTSACWQHCYGIPALLSYIQSKNIPMGVVSNFDPRIHTILTNMKLKDYFKFVISSYEVGVLKPNKEIFDLALEKSEENQIKPEECLHIGDKASLDYQGAKQWGWNAYLISDKNLTSLQAKYDFIDPNHVFGSAYQLHIGLMKNSGDSLPTPEQEIPT